MPYLSGGYDTALFLMGHSGINMNEDDSLDNVPIPRDCCVVNIVQAGEVARFSHIDSFYDYIRNTPNEIFLDPETYASQIEYEVNQRIERDVTPIKLSFTVCGQNTPNQMHTMASNQDDAWYGISGINELSAMRRTHRSFWVHLGLQSGNNVPASTIEQCYATAVFPSSIDVTRACGTNSRTVSEWASCIKSKFKRTTKQVLDIAKSHGRCVVYNFGCRTLEERYAPLGRALRQQSADNQKTLKVSRRASDLRPVGRGTLFSMLPEASPASPGLFTPYPFSQSDTRPAHDQSNGHLPYDSYDHLQYDHLQHDTYESPPPYPFYQSDTRPAHDQSNGHLPYDSYDHLQHNTYESPPPYPFSQSDTRPAHDQSNDEKPPGCQVSGGGTRRRPMANEPLRPTSPHIARAPSTSSPRRASPSRSKRSPRRR